MSYWSESDFDNNDEYMGPWMPREEFMEMIDERNDMRARARKRIAAKKKVDYQEYLLSDHWEKMRRRALYHDGYKCADCMTAETLQIHHLSYLRIGHERMTDLITVCESCHLARHPEVREIINIL